MTLIDFDVDIEATQGFKTQWGAENLVFTKQTTGVDQSAKAAKMNANTMGTGVSNDLPGVKDASSKIDAIHTDKMGYIGDVIRRWVGSSTKKRVWAAFESLNALAPMTFQPCSFSEYSVKSTEKEVTKASIELYARGAFYAGHFLVSPKGNSQLIVTGTGSDCDESTGPLPAGPSSFGGAALLVIYDLSGGTTPTITVSIEHSANGTTWTLLTSFVIATNATAATTFVQLVKITSTTVILAHTHAAWTTSTSANAPTSCQALVAIGRGIDPDS